MESENWANPRQLAAQVTRAILSPQLDLLLYSWNLSWCECDATVIHFYELLRLHEFRWKFSGFNSYTFYSLKTMRSHLRWECIQPCEQTLAQCSLFCSQPSWIGEWKRTVCSSANGWRAPGSWSLAFLQSRSDFTKVPGWQTWMQEGFYMCILVSLISSSSYLSPTPPPRPCLSHRADCLYQVRVKQSNVGGMKGACYSLEQLQNGGTVGSDCVALHAGHINIRLCLYSRRKGAWAWRKLIII